MSNADGAGALEAGGDRSPANFHSVGRPPATCIVVRGLLGRVSRGIARDLCTTHFPGTGEEPYLQPVLLLHLCGTGRGLAAAAVVAAALDGQVAALTDGTSTINTNYDTAGRPNWTETFLPGFSGYRIMTYQLDQRCRAWRPDWCA